MDVMESTEAPLSLSKRNPTQPLPLRSGAVITATLHTLAPHTAIAYAADVYSDGYPAVVLENDKLRLVVSPCAGARALVFEDKTTGENVFTTVGGLRDAWTPQLPPSSRDYIAKYTHPIATGTFNRCYSYRTKTQSSGASASFAYAAPDAPPNGAAFERTIALEGADTWFTVTSSGRFRGTSHESPLQITSFTIRVSSQIVRTANGYGIFDRARKRVAFAVWAAGCVTAHALARHNDDALMMLTMRQNVRCDVIYGITPAATPGEAQARLRAFANRRPSSASTGEVAER